MSEPQARDATFANPQAGDVLAGKYRIESVLGKGGMGAVVAATHIQLGQRVAIKYLLRPDVTDIVARFLREARAAVRLRSEHVARVLDVGEFENGAPYMVMEYLQGDDLAHHLKAKGALPVEEAIDYLLQTCEAIAEAHAAGMVHRDLKPANLFLMTTPDGSKSVKVLDFGISKVSESEEQGGDGMALTKTEMILGSPLYMSPEQLKASRDVDARSDIWALGVILYQLLAGKLPFHGTAFPELILKVNLDHPAPISDFRGDVPKGLEAAVFKCLEKKAEHRFQNIAEFALCIATFGSAGSLASAEKARRVLESVGIKVETPKPYEPSGISRQMNAAALTAPDNSLLAKTPASISETRDTANTQSSLKTVVMNKSGSTLDTKETSGRRGMGLIAVSLFAGLGIAAVAVFTLRSPTQEPIAPAAITQEKAATESAAQPASPAPDVKPVGTDPLTVAAPSGTTAPAAPSQSAAATTRPTTNNFGTKAGATDKSQSTPANTSTTKTPVSKNPLNNVSLE